MRTPSRSRHRSPKKLWKSLLEHTGWRAEKLPRRAGLIEQRVAEHRIPPARLDRAQVAALLQADQPVVVARGHVPPEADGPERLERLDEDIARGVREELRVAERVLAIAHEL